MSRRSRRNRKSQGSARGKLLSGSAGAEEMVQISQGEVRSLVQEELLVARAELFTGPLPHPDHLAEYERTQTGAANRIIRMAEEEAEHRRRLESLVVESNVKMEGRGQVLGFIIAMTALIGGIYIMALGESLWGAAMAIAAVTGLSGLFIWTRREKKRELSGKEDDGTISSSVAPPSPPRGPGRNRP